MKTFLIVFVTLFVSAVAFSQQYPGNNLTFGNTTTTTTGPTISITTNTYALVIRDKTGKTMLIREIQSKDVCDAITRAIINSSDITSAECFR